MFDKLLIKRQVRLSDPAREKKRNVISAVLTIVIALSVVILIVR